MRENVAGTSHFHNNKKDYIIDEGGNPLAIILIVWRYHTNGWFNHFPYCQAVQVSPTPCCRSLFLGAGISSSGTTLGWLQDVMFRQCAWCSYTMSSAHIIWPKLQWWGGWHSSCFAVWITLVGWRYFTFYNGQTRGDEQLTFSNEGGKFPLLHAGY